MARDLAFSSATELAALIAGRGIGCVELLDHLAARIARHNPSVNAVVAMDLDRARAAARAADQVLVTTPLHGVPMTVKESFNVAGLPTTMGLLAHRDNIAGSNALAVDRLQAAGAIVFGKTNVPPFLADSQSSNPVYGATGNPWNLAMSPGGSSGGSAAALATGMTGLELGSDIAGSLRNPAHYCGVFAHKPSHGICQSTGHGLGTRIAEGDISAIGPMARGAADLEMALDVIAGPDAVAGQAWSLNLPQPRFSEIRGARVAVVLNDAQAEVDAPVQAAIERLGRFLADAGAEVSFTARPDFASAELAAIYMRMVRAATSGRLEDAAFAEQAAQAAHLDPDSARYGDHVLQGNTMSHRIWLRLNERRHQIRMAWNRFFEDYDLLLCPIAVTTAFPRTEVPVTERSLFVNGRDVAYSDQFFWSGYAGVALLPATVAPIGLAPDGLPVGVQIIGGQYQDRSCIALARFVEREFHGFVPPPGYE